MQRIELQQLSKYKRLRTKLMTLYLRAISQGKHKATEHKEERNATLSAEIKTLAYNVRYHNKHDEYKSQRL